MSEVPRSTASAETAAPWGDAADAFRRWRSGESSAIDDLVRLLSPVLWHVVRATGLDREQAEDVVQSTWLALVDHADSIERPQAVAGWLCTTARRSAWRVSKQSRQQVPVEDEVIDVRLPQQAGPEREVLLEDESARLWACLDRLPERCRKLLRMVAAEARPDYAGVSEALDMPIGSIGPTRGRCLEKLRHELVETGGIR